MTGLTILTPTYNRAHTLRRLFGSLQAQSCRDFEWLIVDDGSTDTTALLVEQFQSSASFPIRYVHKDNGGKHTAINAGLRDIGSTLTFIVDSDDFLTNDAVEIITSEWGRYKNVPKICGLSFLRCHAGGQVIGDYYPEDGFVSDYLACSVNEGVTGDKAEVFLTSILKEYPFPVFEGENFIGESAVWAKIGQTHCTIYVNKAIYVCEYLPDGLSNAGRGMRIRNPLGAMYTSDLYVGSKCNLVHRLNKALLYTCYGFFSKKTIRDIVLSSSRPALVISTLPLGWLLFSFWRIKYSPKS